MKKEFICMEEDAATTQKLIRTWVSTGYTIDIIAQNVSIPKHDQTSYVVTSLWRWK